MGSSPVTATNHSSGLSAASRVDHALRTFFGSTRCPLQDGDGLLVAFSGGADSLALLDGLARLRSTRPLRLVAAHLDHGLDPGSAERAERARRLSRELDVECLVERRSVEEGQSGVEAAARAARYAFLESARELTRCRYVLTAHHLDDQAETVALRLLLGSGLAGLAAIRPIQGSVVRPLLTLRRAELLEALAESGLDGLEDPTNRDLRFPRNRLRVAVLPWLARDDGKLALRLAALAARAQGANRALDRRLLPWFTGAPGPPRLPLAHLRSAPTALQLRALALLHRLSSYSLPPSAGACAQLLAQLAAGSRLDCDCGEGRRWVLENQGLAVVGPAEPRTPPFTYTFPMPGRMFIPELGLGLEVRPSRAESWMFAGASWRAGLALPQQETLVVRNRRPGDRMRPLGAAGSRRLKEILIDAKVPQAKRDRLPLLLSGGEIAWVPGITIDERCRLDRSRPSEQVWVAEVTS